MFKIAFGNESEIQNIQTARTEALYAYDYESRIISNDAARTIAGFEYEWSKKSVNVFSLMYHGKPFDPAIAVKVLGERIRLLHAPGVVSDVQLDTSDTRLIGLLMLVSTVVTLAIEDVVNRVDSKNAGV